MLPTILDVLLLVLTVTKTYQIAKLLDGEFGSPIVCGTSLVPGLMSALTIFSKSFTLLRDGVQ